MERKVFPDAVSVERKIDILHEYSPNTVNGQRAYCLNTYNDISQIK